MLDLIWSLCGFIVAISLLVCFHEFGHYWMARRMGVKVLRFSLGWGKPIRSYHAADGVEWSLAPYPIGGYVKMLDEREGPVAPAERSMAFNNKPVGARMAILFAGPAANFILAALLFWCVLVMGQPDWQPILAAPDAGSVAERAGLQEGDRVVRVGDERIDTLSVLNEAVLDQVVGSRELALTVDRDGRLIPAQLDLSSVRVEPEHLFTDIGIAPYRPPVDPVIAEVVPGSAAAAAGLLAGDRIRSHDGEPVNDWAQLVAWVQAHAGTPTALVVDRNGVDVTLNAVIGHKEDDASVGYLGAGAVQPDPQLWQHLRAERRLGPLEAIPAAVTRTGQTSLTIVRMLWRMITGDISLKNVGGPVQIAQVAGETAQVGLVWYLGFLAGLSVSLGVLNLLPVPLLDGGHLLTYAAEAVRGRPLSERVLAASQYVGLAFIGMLMVVAFYNDIMRLI